METKAFVAVKKSENRLDEIESRMTSLRLELNQMGSQIECLNRLNLDRLKNTMDLLPKVEESLLSLVRHLEVGDTLKLELPIFDGNNPDGEFFRQRDTLKSMNTCLLKTLCGCSVPRG